MNRRDGMTLKSKLRYYQTARLLVTGTAFGFIRNAFYKEW